MVLYLYKKLQDANYGLSNATGTVLILVDVLFIVCIRRLFNGRDEEAPAKRKGGRQE